MSTRRKRRRRSPSSLSVNSTNCQSSKNCRNDDVSCDRKILRNTDERITRRKDASRRCCYTLETLPPEVLEMILRLLPLQDVAGSIRLVSRRCSSVATTVLNGAFFIAGLHLDRALIDVESKMSTTTTETELITWSGAFNVLELIKAQYKMLKAVTWRYTHPPTTAKFNRVCFYAGSLIDELNVMINIARTRPAALYANYRREEERGHEEEIVTSAGCHRLAAFVSLSKRFMNYFEKVSECKLNRSALVSGCKAVDVLDCLAEGRQVTGFRIYSERVHLHDGQQRTPNNSSNNRNRSIITMRLRYVMRRAWFTCLEVPTAPDETSWREDQRFMYLRLRRLVGSVNEHYYEKSHYDRDVLLRAKRQVTQRTTSSRPPLASTYSGYGVYAGRFFYYGNMNKYAYRSKFKDFADVTSDESGRDNDDDDDDDQDDEDDERPMVSNRGRPPAFDLVIRVELRCSSDLAPLAVRSTLRANDLDYHVADGNSRLFNRDSGESNENSPITKEHSELYLKVNITCPASAANRLPGNFTWEQRCPSNDRRQKRRFYE